MIKRKKIGIVTFHKAQSYGALLQSYALQQTIKELFPDAAVGLIDLYPERFSKNSTDKKYRIFYEFAQQHLAMLTAEKTTLTECLQSLLEPSEAITDLVAGSDQIWNPRILKECLKDYFMHGDMGRINKVAYAASFGTKELDTDQETAKIITEALAGYNKIAVREASGVDLCRNFGRNDAVNVLDPTLTANPEIYDKFRRDGFMLHRICGFFLAREKYQFRIMKKIAKKLNSKPVMLGLQAPFLSFIESCSSPKMEDFISAISNADCVVTDSFHGVCFSIIFRKQFVVLPSRRRERFTRIEELLQLLDLKQKIISDYSPDRAARAAMTLIDYDAVAEKLSVMHQKSRAFLTMALHSSAE